MPKNDRIALTLSREELSLAINALNYVTHGIELGEFATLMGATHQEATDLLERLARAAR